MKTDLTNPQGAQEDSNLESEELLTALDKGEVEFVAGDEEEGEEGAPPAGETTPVKETFTIVHNGAEHNFDKDRLIEFAQKGFDYDTKVGPHHKLVQLIDQDPEAQVILNTHFSRKMGLLPPAEAPVAPAAPVTPEPFDVSKVPLTSFRDADDEKMWFRENMEKVLTEYGRHMERSPTPAPAPATAPTAPSPSNVNPMVMLQRHDPVHFQQVLPHIDTYAEQLSVPEYRRCTSSIPNFLDFYDKVKEQVVGQSQGNPGNPPTPKRFNLKPSGTPTPTKTKRTVNVWDLGKDDFNALVQRMINT